MAKLSVADVQNFKQMMNDLKAQFNKKREEAKGSHERMKYYAQKCVQAHNEAEKRKALGRPGIDPKLAAKKKKKSAEAEPEAPWQDRPSIVFPTSMTARSQRSLQQLQSKRRHGKLRLKPGRESTESATIPRWFW